MSSLGLLFEVRWGFPPINASAFLAATASRCFCLPNRCSARQGRDSSRGRQRTQEASEFESLFLHSDSLTPSLAKQTITSSWLPMAAHREHANGHVFILSVSRVTCTEGDQLMAHIDHAKVGGGPMEKGA